MLLVRRRRDLQAAGRDRDRQPPRPRGRIAEALLNLLATAELQHKQTIDPDEAAGQQIPVVVLLRPIHRRHFAGQSAQTITTVIAGIAESSPPPPWITSVPGPGWLFVI